MFLKNSQNILTTQITPFTYYLLTSFVSTLKLCGNPFTKLNKKFIAKTIIATCLLLLAFKTNSY